MQKLSMLSIMAFTVLTGASSLYSQATSSQGGPYTQPSNISNSSRTNSYDSKLSGSDAIGNDADIAQKIRWAIRADKSLSPLAKSVEVSVKDFNVALSGTVNNEEEKNKVA